METVIVKTERLKGIAEELALFKNSLTKELINSTIIPKNVKKVYSMNELLEDVIDCLSEFSQYLYDYANDVEAIEKSVKEINFYDPNVNEKDLFVLNNDTQMVVTTQPDKDNYVTKSDNNTIDLNQPISRAFAVSMLYEIFNEGKEDTYSNIENFSDIDDNSSYSTAIKWAKNEGITSGYDGNNFRPNSYISRAQFITMLWRAYGSPKIDGEITFNDIDENKYYSEAIKWARSVGITKGTTDNTFSPNEPLTNKQAQTFLQRFSNLKEDEKTIREIPKFDEKALYNSLNNVNEDGVIDINSDLVEITYIQDNEEHILKLDTLDGKLNLKDLFYTDELLNNIIVIKSIEGKDLSVHDKIYRQNTESNNYGGDQDNIQWLVLDKLSRDIRIDMLRKLDNIYEYNEEISVYGMLWTLGATNEEIEAFDNETLTKDDLLNIIDRYETTIAINDVDSIIATNIIDRIIHYYPEATEEDIKNIACMYANQGCGFMATANIFMEFVENNFNNAEEFFNNEFAYNMIVRTDNGAHRYNLETLAIDMFLYLSKQDPYNCTTIDRLTELSDEGYIATFSYDGCEEDYQMAEKLGVGDPHNIPEFSTIFKRFFEEHNIETNITSTTFSNGLEGQVELVNYLKEHQEQFPYNMLFARGYRYEYTGIREGDILNEEEASHAFTVTDIDDDNNIIISSWGEKFKFSTNEFTRYFKVNTYDFKLKE